MAETGDLMKYPIVRLKNGLRVANFGGEETIFTTGEVLPAVRSFGLDAEEVETPHPNLPKIVDVKFCYSMSQAVRADLIELGKLDVDVILVPTVVAEAVAELITYINEYSPDDESSSDEYEEVPRGFKICRVRYMDRKTGLTFPDRFLVV